jgi:hypothetical protein
MQSLPQLLEMIPAGVSTGVFPGVLNRRQNERNQDGRHPDHRQQFNQRKCRKSSLVHPREFDVKTDWPVSGSAALSVTVCSRCLFAVRACLQSVPDQDRLCKTAGDFETL